VAGEPGDPAVGPEEPQLELEVTTLARRRLPFGADPGAIVGMDQLHQVGAEQICRQDPCEGRKSLVDEEAGSREVCAHDPDGGGDERSVGKVVGVPRRGHRGGPTH